MTWLDTGEGLLKSTDRLQSQQELETLQDAVLVLADFDQLFRN